MKSTKKFTALLLTLCMVAGVLAGCSQTQSTATTADSTASGTSASDNASTLVASSNHFEGKFSPCFCAERRR